MVLWCHMYCRSHHNHCIRKITIFAEIINVSVENMRQLATRICVFVGILNISGV